MKLNKIMFFFILGLPVSIALRMLQLNFTVDYITGFYHTNKEALGNSLMVVILLVSVFTGFFARLTFSKPENPPKPNIFSAVCSVALCVGIFNENFIQPLPATLLSWQITLLNVVTIITVIYLLCYALSFIVKFPLPKILSAIPIVYLLVKIVCDFTVISKLSLISDNIITIAAYCSVLLFFLNFSKLYNGIDDDTCFKKLLSYGLPAVTLSFTSSIPNLIFNTTCDYGYSHTPIQSNISVLLFGVLTLSLILSYFYQRKEG